MSYSDREWGADPYVTYRKVTARKAWPCLFAKAGGDQCDGTIHPGEVYIDETWAPWTPIFDETGEDGYGRPTFGQVDVVGSWGHHRYHLACEEGAVFGTPQQRAAEEAAEAARHARELAERDQAEREDRARRKARQQHNSRKARREREIAAHAAEVAR